MADFPALPLWTDAYLADTRLLTTEEHGAYLLLLMEAWRRPRCRLPNDPALLAKLAGLPLRRWKAVIAPVLMRFWTEQEPGWLTQKRLLNEYEYVINKREKSSLAGSASAARRQSMRAAVNAEIARENLNGRSSDAATETQPELNKTLTPTPTPLSKKESVRESPLPSKSVKFQPNGNQPERLEVFQVGYDLVRSDGLVVGHAQVLTANGSEPAGFAEFWQAYPKRVSRLRAQMEFARALHQGATVDALVAGAASYARKVAAEGSEERFVQDPGNWISAGRWADEPYVAPAPERTEVQQIIDRAVAAEEAAHAAKAARADGPGEIPASLDRRPRAVA